MKILITKPHSGRVKSRAITVKGIAKALVPVQLYVLANDGKWYLQQPAVFVGFCWSVECVLGLTDGPKSQKYVIVALATPDRPETPLDTLPSGVVRSNKIVVHV